MSTQGQGDVVVEIRERVFATVCPTHRFVDGEHIETQEGRISAADFGALLSEIDRLRTLLSSSRGEQGWLAIENAPKTRPIIGKTAAGRIVKAKWVRLDDDNAGWGTPEEDDPRPNCWNDGFCWASNSDEQPSDPLVAYIEMPGSVPTSLAGQVPDGYVLVPKEPTEEMLVLGESNMDMVQPESCGPNTGASRREELRFAWYKMLSAVPQPTAGGDAENG